MSGSALFCLCVLVRAFEFSPLLGTAGAILAGTAVSDWQAQFSHNPALTTESGRLAGGAAYCAPFGLADVHCAAACLGSRVGGWAGGLSVTSLSFDAFRETDVHANAGWMPLPGLSAGVGAHWMTVDQGRYGVDWAPKFDVGALWETGRLRLGAAALGVNMPRFANGDELGLRLLAGAAFRPVESLVLALDLNRYEEQEGVSLGAEFRLVPPLALRAGGGVGPLSYGSGLRISAGSLAVDYAYRFHPQLKETHAVGLQAAWR
ncbi:MAG: hypothetical protein JSU73_10840 [candidate division WOR-3 bacterium]|nr:MAG: hypothetical protein JSU73_10840 [candidate division WOR-3 bacterium]